ncbi:hypothetical protein Clacol_006496 [Clathrus columnatus]|uniref:Serine/arginine repetitive matrix protein 2 n=1 Tax=Clathrus columnatus TaxID=1419009 RepID=A0AAV5AD07_9AGAM|nr:hypothetical protein Clacol_006496 [Clathrus columnatus]
MNTLPPKPEDSLPPRPVRGGVSPRASLMRDSRDRNRDRDRDKRRSPPRSPSWRRLHREDDRYQDQSSWLSRDRDDRRTRQMDRYVPQGGHNREYRRSRSRSRSRSPPGRRRRSYSSRSRSRSPRRHHRSPARLKREPSRGSPKRAQDEPATHMKEETSNKSTSIPEPSEPGTQESTSRAISQLPSKPSHTPTGPRLRSPVPTREKESRMRDNDNTRFPPKNSRRFTKDSRSHSRSRSRSKSPSRSIIKSRQSTPASHPLHNIRKPRLEDFLLPPPVRDPKDSEFDADVKRLNDQRVKLEGDHVNAVRAVRRAQHELGLAMLELKSAEERRKVADRVHEKTVQGFTAFVT